MSGNLFDITGIKYPEYWNACKMFGVRKVRDWTFPHLVGNNSGIWPGDVDGTTSTYQMERKGHFCFFEFKTENTEFGKHGQMQSLVKLIKQLSHRSVLFVIEHRHVDVVHLDADVTKFWIVSGYKFNIIQTPALMPDLLEEAIGAWAEHADERPNCFMSELYKLCGVLPISWGTPHPWSSYCLPKE
jgi:hypothetical protein